MKVVPNSLPSNYLFAYGSLQRDFDNEMSRLVERSFSFTDKGYIEGSLYDVGEFPAAIMAGRPGSKVHGELFRIPPCEASLVELLDEYEGCPQLYERVLAEVTTNSGKTVNAMVYVYKRTTQDLNHIESGDYVEYYNDASRI